MTTRIHAPQRTPARGGSSNKIAPAAEARGPRPETHVLRLLGNQAVCRALEANRLPALDPIGAAYRQNAARIVSATLSRAPRRIQRQNVARTHPPPPIMMPEPRAERQQILHQVNQAFQRLFPVTGTVLPLSSIRILSSRAFRSGISQSRLINGLIRLFSTRRQGGGGLPFRILNDSSAPPNTLLSGVDIFFHNSSPEELRPWVTARVRAGFFTYRDPTAVGVPFAQMRIHRIGARELYARFVAGYTTMEEDRDRRRMRLQGPASLHTLIHEATHYYTSLAFARYADSTTGSPPQQYDDILLAPILKEGFTEFFALQVMNSDPTVFGGLQGVSYGPQVAQAERIIDAIGLATAANAYFAGDAAAIARLQAHVLAAMSVRDVTPGLLTGILDRPLPEQLPPDESRAPQAPASQTP